MQIVQMRARISQVGKQVRIFLPLTMRERDGRHQFCAIVIIKQAHSIILLCIFKEID
jgi:hypothetical protein